MGLRILKNLDLLVLAIALPVFVGAGLPVVGWVAATAAWVLAKGVERLAERRAIASGDRRVAMGARAASLLTRLYSVGIAVFLAGLVEREAGLAAGVLSVIVFTVYFATLFIVKPLEEAQGR